MGADAVHPTDQTLHAFGLGKLDDVSSGSVSKHLESCRFCQRRVAELSSDEFLGRLRNAQGSPEMSAANRPQVGDATTDRVPAVAVAIAPPPAGTMPPGLAEHPDYEVIRELGRGGMGVVYLVRNKLMGRLEVLKIVGGHLVERPGVRDRFLREVQAAAKLQHKNIVAAYSAMRLGESIVLAMEFIDGEDLAEMVKSRGPLPVVHACYFIYQAALGLQHAHERGMVHRDIKPANLIFATEGKKGVVKVLDFGLAKVTSEGQTDSGLTREGQMLGTPDYIAPEQIRDAQSADIRADIYSLGCTLYYLLTGGPPFRGDHLWDLYQAHFSMDAGPLNLVRPEVPVELAAVVAKMMAKEPRRRFQTPGEVAQALTPFFKPAATQPARPSAEMPRLETRVASTQPSSAVPGPAEPATLATAPTAAGRRPQKNVADGVAWESLIEIKEDEPLIEAAKPKRAEPKPAPAEAQVRRPPWVWRATIAASVFGVLLLGVIIYLATDKGRIKIVVDGPQPIITIDGETIRIEGLDEPITLRAGEHVLTVKRGNAEVETCKFVVRRGENNEVLHVEYEPRMSNREGTNRPTSQSGEEHSGDAAPPKSIENSIGMTLKLIPAGEFLMGSPDNDTDAENDEKPPHKVRISPFYLGVTEVTQEQYRAVMGKNPSCFSSTGGGKEIVGGRSTDRLPVELVSWIDAIEFCNALSKKDRLKAYYNITGVDVRVADVKGSGYRLPTEAEWEYACRAGKTTKYSFGDDPSELGEYAWHSGNSGGMTHPVGQKRPNTLGLYDMHGNVWEWCWDGYDGAYYGRSPVDDPPGASGASDRVGRGGSWDYEPRYCRSADRSWSVPARRVVNLGFRLAQGLAQRGSLTINDGGAPTRTAHNDARPDEGRAAKPASSQGSIENSIGMTLKLIPAGEFMMGSPAGDKLAEADETQHKVRISAFYLGVTEVTQEQYGAVTGNNPSWFSSTGGGREMVAGRSTDQLPVEQISWLEAIKFCNALSKKDRFGTHYEIAGDSVRVPGPTGAGYRLPTEAEWEYACRAENSKRYSFGDEPSKLADYAWYATNADWMTHRVGQKLPKAFGLYDMHGNIWEWCWDWHDGTYYGRSPVDDPPGPEGASAREFRGGSWNDPASVCRSARRNGDSPAYRHGALGFRLARSPSAAAAGDSGSQRTSAPPVPAQRLAQEPPVPTAGRTGKPPVSKPTASSTDALQPGTSWRGTSTVLFTSWTNDVAKPRPLWLTIKARKVTRFKAVADSPGRSREVEGTFKHGVIHWNGPNGNSSWEGKLVGNQLVGTFKATSWQGDSAGKFRLTLADGLPPATSPARVPPTGPVRLGSVRGEVWKVEGDELVREGQGDGWVSFGDPDWTDYDLTYEARKSSGPDGFGGSFRQGEGQSYGLAIGGLDGKHYLHRWLGSPPAILVQSIPGTIEPLRWYKVKVSLRRQRIRIELDDHVLFSGTDDFKLRGSVSLRFFNSAGRFRNIKVTAPDGTVLWEGPPDLP